MNGRATVDEREVVARRLLARPPAPPRDPGLFTSGTLFGQPGIYPDGPPMAPAVAPAAGPGTLSGGGRPGTLPAAALAVLSTTVAAPLVKGFPHRTAAHHLAVGTPASPGRVVGPPAGGGPPSAGGIAGAGGAPGSGSDGGPDGLRVVNRRYAAEDPRLVASSLAHDLLWVPGLAVHVAETLLHALNAMVHLQLVARDPTLAHQGTELCRRQNALAVTLCNSRRPGSDRMVLVAPDGPGTIPGGATGMTTPDFWSVPFAPVGEAVAPDGLRSLAAEVFEPLADETSVDGDGSGGGAPGPFAFTDGWGRWFGAHLGRSWLPPLEQLRAAVALGLVTPEQVVVEGGRPDAVEWLGLADAVTAWDR